MWSIPIEYSALKPLWSTTIFQIQLIYFSPQGPLTSILFSWLKSYSLIFSRKSMTPTGLFRSLFRVKLRDLNLSHWENLCIECRHLLLCVFRMQYKCNDCLLGDICFPTNWLFRENKIETYILLFEKIFLFWQFFLGLSNNTNST